MLLAWKHRVRKLVGTKNIFRIIARNHLCVRLRTRSKMLRVCWKWYCVATRCAMCDLSFNENLQLKVEYFSPCFRLFTYNWVFFNDDRLSLYSYIICTLLRLERMRIVRIMLIFMFTSVLAWGINSAREDPHRFLVYPFFFDVFQAECVVTIKLVFQRKFLYEYKIGFFP